ncbi:hypothetical protein J6590_066553 [Homalodisca vitripennis]|nr:hypothetical protein J6590_066553 [Homalodisca vitripennis]
MSSLGMLDRFRYWRWLGNGSSSDDYEFPTFIGVTMDRFLNWRWLGIRNRIKFGRLLIPYVVGGNVGSVSVLALVRKRSSSDDYEFPTFIGVNFGSVSQLALVRNQFGIMLLPYVVGGNVGSVTVLALVRKRFKFG